MGNQAKCVAIKWLAMQMDQPDFMNGLTEVILWVGQPFPMVIVESKSHSDSANRPRRGVVAAFNQSV